MPSASPPGDAQQLNMPRDGVDLCGSRLPPSAPAARGCLTERDVCPRPRAQATLTTITSFSGAPRVCHLDVVGCTALDDDGMMHVGMLAAAAGLLVEG